MSHTFLGGQHTLYGQSPEPQHWWMSDLLGYWQWVTRTLSLWADRLWVAGVTCVTCGRAGECWVTDTGVTETRACAACTAHSELGSWPGLPGSGSSGHHQPHQRRQSSRPGDNWDTGHRRGQRHRAPIMAGPVVARPVYEAPACTCSLSWIMQSQARRFI